MMHGFIPSERFFAYLTWTDIDSMPNRENVVIIQPVGAIEQHGPHLPLIVDAAINMGTIGKALTYLDSSTPAYALPCLYYGKSNEHSHFPGTISLSSQSLSNILLDVAESVYQAGFRKLIFLNSHGGQPQIIEIVARDIHHKYPDFLVFPHFIWRAPNLADQLLTPQELKYGMHAGDAETSILLALLPNQVKIERAVKEYPQGLPENSLLTLEDDLPFAWLTQELSNSGIIGDPTVASKEKGDILLESLAKSWAQVFQNVYEFRQPHQPQQALSNNTN
jgi:creatinine amidohydrolase